MKKKNLVLALLVFTSTAYTALATQHRNLFDELSCESKNLTIRPLIPEEYEEAKALDQSDHSFLSLFSDDEISPLDEGPTADSDLDTLQKATTLLKEKTLAELATVRQRLPRGFLYFGVFARENSRLTGVIKFINFQPDWMNGNEIVKHLLGTDVKFHRNSQGKGYASEAYQTVFSHFTALKLIPESPQEAMNTPFLGVHALIHLTNKASLKCLAFNSGAKIGRLFGDRVDVYYPGVPTIKQTEDYMPLPDANLDKDTRLIFTDYLSKDVLKSEPAEKELYAVSFQKFLDVTPSLREKALEDEFVFILRALAKLPHLFNLVDASLLLPFNGMITEMEDSFPSRESIPCEHQAKWDETMACLGKVREKLPRPEKEESKEESTKENAQEESKKAALNDAIDPATPEKQISN